MARRRDHRGASTRSPNELEAGKLIASGLGQVEEHMAQDGLVG